MSAAWGSRGCRAFPLPLYWPVKTIAKKTLNSKRADSCHSIGFGWGHGYGHSGPKVGPITVQSEDFSALEVVILMTSLYTDHGGPISMCPQNPGDKPPTAGRPVRSTRAIPAGFQHKTALNRQRWLWGVWQVVLE